MLPIKPCAPYHAIVRNKVLFRDAGKTAFKVYFVDIIGRPDPARTEWDKCGLSPTDYLSRLGRTDGIEGIGFIVAFPHITKAFRFGPENEIVINVRAWWTKDMAPVDLTRSDGYVEFACLAEAAIAADEFSFWAAAQTVDEYLGKWSGYAEGPIARNDKLRAYWE
jgi:hypothetical protein